MKRLLGLFAVICTIPLQAVDSVHLQPVLTATLSANSTVMPEPDYREGSVFIEPTGNTSLSVKKKLKLTESETPHTRIAVCYLQADHFQKIKLTVTDPVQAHLFLNGESIKAGTELPLVTGTHQLMVLLHHDGKSTIQDPVSIIGFTGACLTEPERPLGHPLYPILETPTGMTASPDGRYVAMTVSSRKDDGETEHALWLLHADTRPIVRHVIPDTSSPVFTADGCFLYGIRKNTILRVSLADMTVREIRTFDKRISGLLLSANGQQLIFRMSDTWKPDKKGDYDLWLEMSHRRPDWKSRGFLFSLSRDGQVLTRLTGPADVTGYDLRGNRLLYAISTSVDRYPWYQTEIFLTDMTENVTTSVGIYERGISDLTWLSDKYALVSSPERPYNDETPMNYYQTGLHQLELQTGALTPLSADQQFTMGVNLIYTRQITDTVQVLPDGSAYILVTENGRGAVYHLKETVLKRVDAPEGMVQGFRMTGSGPLFIASAIDRFPTLYRGLEAIYTIQNRRGSEAVRLSPYKTFTFTSKTGYPIHNTLVYPAHFEKGHAYPLIVFFYGGVSACGPVFHPTFQWLSSNGYFVLLTTPRGAVGEGIDFANEHVNEWGSKSAADLVEAVNWIVTQDAAIDRERMGAYSGSYGGFLAMILAEMDTPFKALISEYGISNIASYWGAGYWGYLYGMSALGGAYPWNAPDVYVRKSPLFNADKVRTPLLLMHGDADVNVPVGESDQMFTALKVLERDTAYVRFFDEDHGMKGKFSNWIAQEDFVIAWFDRHLKGQDDHWKHLVEKTLPKPEHKPLNDYFFYSEGEKP